MLVSASPVACPAYLSASNRLEALIGYLHLTNPERLQELFAKLDFGLIDN